MSFQKAPFTRFVKDPLAYRQYTPDDPVQSSIYDHNMDAKATLAYKNTAILHVDSRVREENEEPNKYTYRLGKTYRDVTRVELETADIPNSDYIINEYNNRFYFQDSEFQVDSDSYHTVKLPIGNYLGTSADPATVTIESLLEEAMNDVDPANQYEVSANRNTRIFRIEQVAGSGIFNILFKRPRESECNENKQGTTGSPLPRSIQKILGFKCRNYVNKEVYKGDYCYNLMPHRYIILRIIDFERVDSKLDTVQDAFCIIPFDVSMNCFAVSEALFQWNSESLRKYFNPPKGELDRMHIEFLTPDGNPYNFRGKDHYMVFEITSLSRHQNYHD